jgi:hypothetical protein
MYDEMCRITGQRHDPCLLDTFIAAVQIKSGDPFYLPDLRAGWRSLRNSFDNCRVLTINVDSTCGHRPVAAARPPSPRFQTEKVLTASVASEPIGKERVHFKAPEVARLPAEMSLFLGWFNGTGPVDLVLKAGPAHLWFVTMHPFDLRRRQRADRPRGRGPGTRSLRAKRETLLQHVGPDPARAERLLRHLGADAEGYP